MIEIKNLSKKYGNTFALQDVTLTLNPGEIVGLFGENGAGKTTLIKCILGYLRCNGAILLDGEPVTRRNIERLSFATCEHSFFPTMTAREHKEFCRNQFVKFREKRYQVLMDFFSLPNNKKLKYFSVGQKNQFEVIMALCQGADYILMDEPFSGNDLFNREDFYKVLLGILEPEETILLSTHLIEEVERFVSRAVLLRQGNLVGDVQASELEDQGKSLVGFVKDMYCYQSDRVARALAELDEKGE
ncbi:MAG: ABC transporter ATP-binding protein [Emergencia sp.]|nr:ABC transporter ATP-binding protein [Emergencia sp.]